MKILVDGRPVPEAEAVVSVFDATVMRGDGCFESLRVYDGHPFALDAHLDRLAHSAAALHLELPPRAELAAWIREVARDEASALIRVIITAGNRTGAHPAPSRSFVFPEPLPAQPAGGLRVLPVDAPWHPAGLPWELAGVKSLSYGPHVAARREAVKAGLDDALLVGRKGQLLEGPTWSVAWCREGRLETPSLELGILASITRDAVLDAARELGLEVVEDIFPVSAVYEADEVFALATSKEVLPITALGAYGPHEARTLSPGPQGAALLDAFHARVREDARSAGE